MSISNGVMNYHCKFMVKAPGVITGRFGTIGNVHYVSENYWPHNTALWVTDFIDSHPKYIYYLYKFLKIDRFGTGSGVPTLNRNDVHVLKVSIPKLEEQTAIATTLSDIDTEISHLESRLHQNQIHQKRHDAGTTHGEDAASMSNVGQRERVTQDRVVRLFQDHLEYEYLGNWEYRDNNRNIEVSVLTPWLQAQGVSDGLITRALRVLDQAVALGDGKNLYDANKAVYRLLRYGVKVKEGAGEQNQTVWLIDWENPDNNHFAIAEEVTIQGEHKKRPDIVLYVNGIALGVLELKRSSVSIEEGIRQNLDNQKKTFIRPFFTTMQLVMAGNDTQGLRYGTIETREKYYLQWKEQGSNDF